ncbi:MAG: hypothetical protein AAGF30_00455 [Pseudomonadota bacterium]
MADQDLTARLRENHNSIWQPLMDEAADEIERLRKFARQADARFEDHGMVSMTDRLAYLASRGEESK